MPRKSPAFLPDGLYDQVVTDSLQQLIQASIGEHGFTVADLAAEDAPVRMAEVLASTLARILEDLGEEDGEKPRRQLALVNDLLRYVRHRATHPDAAGAEHVHELAQREEARFDADGVHELLSCPPRLLQAVHRNRVVPLRPEIGLAMPWLFTAGRGTPSLLSELQRELGACDRVDILVSFITQSGVRKLLDILQRITAVDAHGRPGTRLRILTTTYTGATEMQALDLLARLPGVEVRVSLDGRRTRLHAKTWIFHRDSGFGSAYVGSANLSAAAMMGGLEWTVKFTEKGQEELFARARANFETLWEDREFQRYDPENAVHRTALENALTREAGHGLPVRLTFFDLEPKSYQQDMLDQLHAERLQGRHRNLLVAATGTGKTVVAAFDYRRLCAEQGGRPRLLFVAHREEILRQARRTYQEVLRDHAFGCLLVGGAEPDSHDHLFATIDSVSSRGLVDRFGADYWNVVVIDECHRLAANRFDALANAIRPAVLLGLTATPERSDGKSILGYFQNRRDGSPAVELRLWQALDLQLLCPFEYYACDDETDFSSVPWNAPGETAAIDRLVTGNDMRARMVIHEWQRLAGSLSRSRALVFCVSVGHARFMTDRINAAGILAECVVGDSSSEDRRAAPERLARGEINAIVTCDLYNEGVDLPFVNTLLLLRPTQSPVLFQQQIGRGLRLHPGKESCLILDFVGRYREDFRFDRLLSSLTGLHRAQLPSEAENDFPSLPSGCFIHLQRQARERILNSLRRLVQQNWRRLCMELQTYVTLQGRDAIRLVDFLKDQGVELESLYRSSGRSGWTCLKRQAGLLPGEVTQEEEYFGRRFADLLHVDDVERLAFLEKVTQASATHELKEAHPHHNGSESVSMSGSALLKDSCSVREQRLLQMLAYQIDAGHQQKETGAAFLARLMESPMSFQELGELAEVLSSRNVLPARSIPGMGDIPLCLHASYGIREILTAVGWLTDTRRSPFQAGALALPERRTELLFVTLDKREGYHQRIAYHDYAISAERFHWQTQNSAGPDTKVGQRYLESPDNGWQFQLFVRQTRKDPYRACGPVTLLQAEGNRPMSIHWKLAVPLPARLFQAFSVLRDA